MTFDWNIFVAYVLGFKMIGVQTWRNLPINKVFLTNDNVSGASRETNTFENERSNHTHDDLTCKYIYLDKDTKNAIENKRTSMS